MGGRLYWLIRLVVRAVSPCAKKVIKGCALVPSGVAKGVLGEFWAVPRAVEVQVLLTMSVTGPSFTSETCIDAPNTPVRVVSWWVSTNCSTTDS